MTGYKVAAPGGFVPVHSIGFGALDALSTPVEPQHPLPSGGYAQSYADRSVTSLSSGQAAATTPLLAANASRQALMIVPPIDCTLTLISGGSTGQPLYGGVANRMLGQECPSNDLYISGLSAGASVTIWEA